VVLLSGEGGIGKSRLVEVLRGRVVGDGSPHIAFRCSPYYNTNRAPYPVLEHLQRWLQLKRDDSPEEKLRKLEEALTRTSVQVPSPSMGEGEGGSEAGAPVPPILTFPRQGGRETLGEVVLLLAALLSMPIPEGRHPHLLLSPQQRRQRTQDVLVAWLLAEAER
jgi:predicted ATPase